MSDVKDETVAMVKAIIIDLLPPGLLWENNEGSDSDQVLEATARCFARTFELSDDVVFTKSTTYTKYLSEYANELGIVLRETATDEEKRLLLRAREGGVVASGPGFLEDMLNSVGFPILVHPNRPSVDPQIVIDNSIGGGEEAIIVSSGDFYDQIVQYTAIAGEPAMVAGEPESVSGSFRVYKKLAYDVELPTDPKRFRCVYFAGGEVTRDIDGSVISVAPAQIPELRRKELLDLTLWTKGADGWVILFVEFI